MNDPRKVDIYSAAHKRDPFPLYTFLRSEAPVFEVRVPVMKRAWLITRYDDVVLCLQDSDRFVKDPRNAGGARPSLCRGGHRRASGHSRRTCWTWTTPHIEGFGSSSTKR